MEKFDITTEFYRLDQRIPFVVYRPAKDTPYCRIAVLAMHPDADYLSFGPCIELAKRGFLTAAANAGRGGLSNKLASVKCAVEFLRRYPGVKKIVLLGHSGGGSLLTCYQYIAENGADRFQNTDRIIPFEEVETLIPADGMMLFDNNYGIMDVLSIDPAIKSRSSGFERDPQLDLNLPENGYSPDGAHYSEEFKRKFQKAQIKLYQELVACAQEKYHDIKAGNGNYIDNDMLVIPGATNMENGNKLFLQDVSLLQRTRGEHLILHGDGMVTQGIAYTVRPPRSNPRPETYRGALKTTIIDFLKAEVRFEDDFGYDDCSMWGSDWNFNPYSPRANVKGISVPLLIEGNTGSHEFIESEYIFENAAAQDKSVIFLEGADHNFAPVRQAEKTPGQFGDTLAALADYAAHWLAKAHRFL